MRWEEERGYKRVLNAMTIIKDSEPNGGDTWNLFILANSINCLTMTPYLTIEAIQKFNVKLIHYKLTSDAKMRGKLKTKTSKVLLIAF